MSIERGILMKNEYTIQNLPLDLKLIDPNFFFEELIDAYAKLEVYKEKLKDSKVDSSWFLPTLQQKEALSSSMLEGTQATLDEILINEVTPNEKDKNLNEVKNYYIATVMGYEYLKKHDFSDEFFFNMHRTLMEGNVRKPKTVGAFRTEQNCIRRNDPSHAITFVPPDPKDVRALMENLISYMNEANDGLRPLVQIAIIHAQFETIHPFLDGNGRMGRLLITFWLCQQEILTKPLLYLSYFFKQNRAEYYDRLMDVRKKGKWEEWIKFFLRGVAETSDESTKSAKEILELQKRCSDILLRKDGNNSHYQILLNDLFEKPFIQRNDVMTVLNVSNPTAGAIIDVFCDSKILYDLTPRRSRNKLYAFSEYINILNKGTELSTEETSEATLTQDAYDNP